MARSTIDPTDEESVLGADVEERAYAVGMADAAAEAIDDAKDCPSGIRAYRAGCVAYVTRSPASPA